MSVPEWKQTVLDRKRRQKAAGLDPSKLAELPSWKRDIVLKKKSQCTEKHSDIVSNKLCNTKTISAKQEKRAPMKKEDVKTLFTEKTTSEDKVLKAKENSPEEEHILPFEENPWIKSEREMGKLSFSRLPFARSRSVPGKLSVSESSTEGYSVEQEQCGDAILANTPSDLPEAEQEYEMVFKPGFVSKLRNKFSSMSDLLNLDTDSNNYSSSERRKSNSCEDLTADDDLEQPVINFDSHSNASSIVDAFSDPLLVRENMVIIENVSTFEKKEPPPPCPEPIITPSLQYREMIAEELPKPNTVASLWKLFEQKLNAEGPVRCRKILVDEVDTKLSPSKPSWHKIDSKRHSNVKLKPEAITPPDEVLTCEIISEKCDVDKNKEKTSKLEMEKQQHCSEAMNTKMDVKVSPKPEEIVKSTKVLKTKLDEHLGGAVTFAHKMTVNATYSKAVNKHSSVDTDNKLRLLEDKIKKAHEETETAMIRSSLANKHEIAKINDKEPKVLEEELVKPSKIAQPRKKCAHIDNTLISPSADVKHQQEAERKEDSEWVSVGQLQYKEESEEVAVSLDDAASEATADSCTTSQSVGKEISLEPVSSESDSLKSAVVAPIVSNTFDDIVERAGGVDISSTDGKKMSAPTPKPRLSIMTQNDDLDRGNVIFSSADDSLSKLGSGDRSNLHIPGIKMEVSTEVKQLDSSDNELSPNFQNAVVNRNSLPSHPALDCESNQGRNFEHTNTEYLDEASRCESPLPVTNIDDVCSDSENSEESYNMLVQNDHKSNFVHIVSYDEPPEIPSSLPPQTELDDSSPNCLIQDDDIPVSNIDEVCTESDRESAIYMIQSSFGNVIFSTLTEDKEDDNNAIYDDSLVVEFIGDNIVINGKSSLIRERNKNLRIKFSANTPDHYEYPSEQSLLAQADEQHHCVDDHDVGNSDSNGLVNGDAEVPESIKQSSLKTVPVGSAGLGHYSPTKLHQEYQLGQGIPTPDVKVVESQSTQEEQNEDWIKPDDKDIAFSESPTSDLLF